MSRDERLLALSGFVVFTRRVPFAASILSRYLELDPTIAHVVYAPHHVATSPELDDQITRVTAERGVSLLVTPFDRCADPAVVAAVAALPADRLAIVTADLRRMVADRLDPRRTHLRRHRARKKIVIDRLPYEVAPWRTFFPFATVDRHLLGYNHSYAIEREYEKHLDGRREDNPCDARLLAEATWRAAFVDEPGYFDRRPEVVTLAASAADHAEYARVRDALFDGEKTITAVKTKLSKWIQARYPARTVPLDLRRVYDALDRIVATDLPFDRWLVGEIAAIQDHTDALLGHYVRLQQEAGEP